jgi:hypothetical protein
VDVFSTAYFRFEANMSKDDMPVSLQDGKHTLRIQFFQRVGHQFAFMHVFWFILTFYLFGCIQISIHLIHVNCGGNPYHDKEV